MTDDIPKFLRLTAEERAAAWKGFKPKEQPLITKVSDPRKPASISDADWESRKKKIEEVPVVKKKVFEKIDTKGKRWDVKRSRWIDDPFAHLCVPATLPVALPRSIKKVEGNFGIPAGTNREKLAKAMSKRLGEMVTLKELSKLVYGKENEGPCFNVMNGFIHDLKKRGMRFEIIRDKNEKGQVTFGLFALD